MATRDEFLRLVWDDVINSPMRGYWIDNVIRSAENNPNEPFSDLGPVVKRLLSIGASREDLCRIARWASYEAAFDILYMLNDPGIDEDDFHMLHEELLSADPSGKDGRPGSWPVQS